MADLSMDRVREIAEQEPGGFLPSSLGHSLYAGARDDSIALARMVLALTAQRDEAVAVAREAVDGMSELLTGEVRPDIWALRARLAALTTPTGGTDEG